MAASAPNPPILTVASSKSRTHLPHKSYQINLHRKHVLVTCCVKFPGHNNLMALLNYTKEKLQTFIPGSVKQSWKKAKSELLVLEEEDVNWSLLGCALINCICDIDKSIYRNRVLMIPLGLLVGILMTKFLDEISQQHFTHHKDGCIKVKGLLVMTWFFVIVKDVCSCFFGVNDFVVHAVNGGLIQAMWNWKEFKNLEARKSSGAP